MLIFRFSKLCIPFLLLIILQAVRFFKLMGQYRREQRAELAAEKEAVEAERLKARQMLEELERQRAQLGSPEETAASTAENTGEEW
mgnify:CR=1 FL=1